MTGLTWPVPDANESGRKIEYRAWFADKYATARRPYESLFNAIYGDSGAIELFLRNVEHFAPRGPCTLFAVAYKDSSEVLVLSGDGFVYLVDRAALGREGLKSHDRLRAACGEQMMRLEEYRDFDGKALLKVVSEPELLPFAGPIASEPPPTSEAIDLNGPERILTTVYRILRDSAIARYVKQLHRYECQVCGHTITLAGGVRYAEAHHIQPLGEPHNGPDVTTNILCVCPNHHAELDYGVSPIQLRAMRTREGHEIDPRFAHYHNEQIYRFPELRR